MSFIRAHRLFRLLPFLAGFIWLLPGLGAEPASADPSESLFNGPVRLFHLELTPDQMTVLGRTRGMGDPRINASARVTVGPTLFTNVEVHLKGSGSFRQLSYRPSLTLKFPKSTPCFGLTKLHLNNSVHDPGRLNEVLGAELHLQAGVPTPRATPVRVQLNGRDLGVYVLKEGFDKRFLKRHFSDASGNLYDPRWSQDIDNALEADSGPASETIDAPQTQGPGSQSDRMALLRAARTPLLRRASALTNVLDVDRFLATSAVQIFLDDWDGYVRHKNNYRLYHDPAADRMVFLPHGMDLLMGTPRSPLFFPEFKGLVAQSLYAVPSMSQALEHRIRTYRTNLFTLSNLVGIVNRTEARLQEALTNQPQEVRAFYQSRADSLLERLRERVATLESGPPPAIPMQPGQTIPLVQWEPWSEIPQTQLSKTTNTQGQAVLRIQSQSRATYGSWRTRVILPPGNYRFDAAARLAQVKVWEGARDPGVGIRMVPARRGRGAEGSADKEPFQFQFHLTRTNEVFLVAEMAAHSGAVEFLLESLRLTRLTTNEPVPE